MDGPSWSSIGFLEFLLLMTAADNSNQIITKTHDSLF